MYKVLVVTADRLLLESFEVLFSGEERFEIAQIAETGEKAVRVCKEYTMDIVFIDMQLPGITGMETGHLIGQSHPNLSIFVLAAYPINSLLKNSSREFIEDIIEKPVTRPVLKKILGNHKTENEDSVQEQFEKLLCIIKKKDFALLYSGISDITDEIYEVLDQDPVRIYKMLTLIGQALFNTIDFYDVKNKNPEQFFPLNDGLILDKKTSEIWLFRIMNYLFQQNSINRYPLLENIFFYIEDQIKEDITLNKIIEHCAISQGYLSRIFREQLNVSVMEYLHLRKLYLAKAYFYFTEDNIAEIAFRLGYSESSYFSKVFRRYENMSVKQYKNSVRSQK